MKFDQLAEIRNAESRGHSVLRETLEIPLRAEIHEVLTMSFERGGRDHLQNRSQLHQWLEDPSCNFRCSKDLRRDE